MSRTLRDLVGEVAGLLAEAGADAPRLSAQVLAALVLGCPRMDVLLAPRRLVSEAEAERILSLARRRAGGEPLAYITGVREFYGLEFLVCPGVLIPRPETEFIVEEVLRAFAPDEALRFADLGTGSGALGVAIAANLPRARGVLVDTSPAALRVARGNAARNSVDSRLAVVQGDFMASLFRPSSLDLIVSNPPYIGEAELADVEPGVLVWEPRQALVAGPTGLEVYPALAARSWEALRRGGLAFFEMGWKQAREVERILREAGFSDVRSVRDLAGNERIAAGVKGSGASCPERLAESLLKRSHTVAGLHHVKRAP